jgi:hypothetical protein
VDKDGGGVAYVDAQNNIHLIDPYIPASPHDPRPGFSLLQSEQLSPGHSITGASVKLVMLADQSNPSSGLANTHAGHRTHKSGAGCYPAQPVTVWDRAESGADSREAVAMSAEVTREWRAGSGRREGVPER